MIIKSLAKMTQNIVERSIEQAYMKGIEDAKNDERKEIEFLRQWKADVIDSLSKYDCESIEEVYESGRADKYQEIVSEYMLLTEEQVAEIRADAIEEFAHNLKETFNNEFPSNYHCTQPYFTLDNVRVLIDCVAKEQKE